MPPGPTSSSNSPPGERHAIVAASLSAALAFVSRTNPPDRLYHYASAAGLIGILTKKTIFASHIASLNDLTEQHFAESIILEELARIGTFSGFSEVRAAAIQAFQRSRLPAFVACFCESGDNVPMWMGYGGNGIGYALGFDFSALRTSRVGHLVPVRYGAESCRNVSRSLVMWFMQTVNSRAVNATAHGQATLDRVVASGLLSSLVVALQILAASSKVEDFSHEAEWRIVAPIDINATGDDAVTLKFRDRNGLVIPYFEHWLPVNSAGGVNLRYLRFGPSLHDTGVAELATFLLRANAVPDVIPCAASAKTR